jgi:Prophage tail length tape measure protein
MADTTAVAIYKLGMENQQYIASAKAAIGVGNELVASHERLVVSEEKVGGASRLAATAIQRKIEANDKAIQAERKYAEAIAFAARAEEQQVGTAQQRALYLEQEAQKLKRTTDALAAKAKAERDAAQAARDEEAASKNLARIEGEHALALKNTAAALGQDRDALIASANAGNRHAAATLDMMNKIVALNKELQNGKINLAGHAAEIDRVQAAYRNQTTAIATQEAAMRKSSTITGLARHEMINLSRQIQDIGVSLAGGQSPFRILIEQGSQIADIFASSKATVADFFRSIGASIRGLGVGAVAVGIGATVTTLVVGAGAAALAWASAQKDVELALLGIGRASGATAESINKIAKAGASAFGLSISEAREFASILAATGKIGVDQLGPMVDVGKNLAIVLGTNSTEAAKTLGKALAEPGKGIEQLNQALGQFDAATVRHVQNLVAQNKVLEAQKIIMEGVTQATKNAADAVSNTTAFWTALGNKISNAADAVGEYIAKTTGLGQSSAQQLEALIAQWNRLQDILVSHPGIDPTGAIQAQADKLRAQMGLLASNMERVGVVAEDTRRKLLSMADQKLVRDVSPEIAQFEQLKNQAEGLRNLIQRIGESGGRESPILAEMGQTMEQVELSANRAREALSSALTPAARLTAEFELGVKAIQARTSAERAAVTAEQTSLQLAGQNVSASEKRLAVERAVKLEIERQAQAYRDNIAALNDQLQVVSALPGHAQQMAQYQADINARLREGATLMQAEEEAAIRLKIAQEQANRAVDSQIISLRQAVEMERARLEGTEGAVEAAQAYANAIRSGASETKAAALAAATLGANLERAQIAAERMANELSQAQFDLRIQQQAGTAGGPTMGKMGGLPIGGRGAFDPIDIAMMGVQFAKSFSLADRSVKAITEMAATMMNMRDPERYAQAQDNAAQAAQQAAEEQQRAAAAAIDAAEQQAAAAKAAREAYIQLLDEGVKEIVAARLLQGESAQQVNAAIEAGQIQFGTASTRFEAQLDLYKRAGATNAQIAADIRRGVIGEGAKPSELLAALDSLTDAVNSNTDAQLGLSPFYTSQGDRQLGYRGYTVQRGASNIPGTLYGGSTTGTPTAPAAPPIMGGVVNAPGVYGDPVFSTQPIIQVRYVNGRYEQGYYLNGAWVKTGDYAGFGTGGSFTRAAQTAAAVGSFSGSSSGVSWHAEGGIMSAAGPVPLRSYQEGGVANRPQMAIFGEGSQPEAYVPLKGGAIPVKLLPTQAANMNERAKTEININAPLVFFAAEPTREEVRESGFQVAQNLRRLMAG